LVEIFIAYLFFHLVETYMPAGLLVLLCLFIQQKIFPL